MQTSERETIWWLPLLRRMAMWSLVTTIPWGLILMLFLILPWIFVTLWATPQMSGARVRESVSILLNLTPFFPYASGFIVGLTTGFYAPAKQSPNPFFSPFYLDVTGETLVALLPSAFVGLITMKMLLAFVSLNALEEAAIFIFGYCVMFALSLWRAINRALRETKLK